VEAFVKAAIAKHSFDQTATRLSAAGVGNTEVLPLERVLEAPQAHQPGKLRAVQYRGLDFEVPEFPRRHVGADGSPSADTLAPPELGQHSLELLRSAGVDAAQCQQWLASGAVQAASEQSFPWAPVRQPA